MSERLILGEKSFDVKIRRTGDNFTLIIDEEEFRGSYTRTLGGGINVQFEGSNSVCYSEKNLDEIYVFCLLYTSPSPRDLSTSRMPSSA